VRRRRRRRRPPPPAHTAKEARCTSRTRRTAPGAPWCPPRESATTRRECGHTLQVTGTAIGVLRSVPGWGHCVRARVRAYCLRWWWQTIPACQWLAVSGVHVDVAALALWLSRGPMERAMAHQRRPESGGGAGAAGEAASGYLGVSPPSSRINRWSDLACTWRCLNLCFRDPFLFVDRRGRFHVLAHIWSHQAFPLNPISGHGYSEDGYNWSFSEIQPYSNTVQRVDGSWQHFATLGA
jgi:hypothetical protein